MGFEEVEFGSRKVLSARTEPSDMPGSTPARSDQTAAPTALEPPHESSDAVLVPLDQWTKILNQLGNLHQAGQELAEARERAAKAETEALFLRERLRELRDDSAASEIGWQQGSIRSESADRVPELVEVADQDEVDLDLTTDRVLIVKLPARLTRWWFERRGHA